MLHHYMVVQLVYIVFSSPRFPRFRNTREKTSTGKNLLHVDRKDWSSLINLQPLVQTEMQQINQFAPVCCRPRTEKHLIELNVGGRCFGCFPRSSCLFMKFHSLAFNKGDEESHCQANYVSSLVPPETDNINQANKPVEKGNTQLNYFRSRLQ